MAWYNEFGNVFFISIATMFFGCLTVMVKTALKSKCDNVQICCIKIHRRVELETDDDKTLEPKNIV